MQDGPSASTEVVLRHVVKERPTLPAVRSIDRRPAPMRRTMGEAESKQARILAESGPAAKQSLEVVRLRAFLSRMQRILIPIKLWMASRNGRMRGRLTCTQRRHRRGTRERDPTR